MALKIQPGPKLSERTTLRLGGHALAEIVVERPEDAAELDQALTRLGGAPLMLGWGSNLLVADHDLGLAVVSVPSFGLPEVVRREGESVVVRAAAGTMLPRLSSWAATQGLSGLENLTGIPGTVGGAVAMNAGSYGSQTAELLARVLVWSADLGVFWAEPADWQAGYRSFVLRGQTRPWLVLAAELRLGLGEEKAIVQAGREVMAKKKATQPVNAATCGCAFKNPASGSAGQMLDACGFRGKSLGGVGFSDLHANFLVNLGKGTACAALELIDMAKTAVASRYGVDLELEVRIVS